MNLASFQFILLSVLFMFLYHVNFVRYIPFIIIVLSKEDLFPTKIKLQQVILALHNKDTEAPFRKMGRGGRMDLRNYLEIERIIIIIGEWKFPFANNNKITEKVMLTRCPFPSTYRRPKQSVSVRFSCWHTYSSKYFPLQLGCKTFYKMNIVIWNDNFVVGNLYLSMQILRCVFL